MQDAYMARGCSQKPSCIPSIHGGQCKWYDYMDIGGRVMHRYMDVTYQGNAGAVTEEQLPRTNQDTSMYQRYNVKATKRIILLWC